MVFLLLSWNGASKVQGMNGASPLGELTQAIGEGLARPRHAWETLIIVLALIIAGVLARMIAHFLAQDRARRIAARGSALVPPDLPLLLPRLLFPVLALLLLAIGEGALRLGHVLQSAADARLLHLALSLLGTLAVVRVLFVFLRRVLQNAALIARLERAIVIVAVLCMALYATGALEDVVAWLAATKIPLGSAAEVSLWSVLVGSATTLISLLAAMWAGSLIEDRLRAETGLEPNLRTVLARVARALLLLVAILLALAFSGIDLTILSVFGGALGVGLGLGLQRIASSYVSGFILLLDRSLRIGDMVTVDKYYGQVTQIRTRYTVLRAPDGSEAIIPNEMLVSSPVVNSTLSDQRVQLSVAASIAPHADLDLALQVLREAARAQPRVLSEPAPQALVRDFQGGNIALECNFWIADPENGRQNVQSDVAIAIVRAFRQHGIELAVARGELQVLESLGLRMAGSPPA